MNLKKVDWNLIAACKCCDLEMVRACLKNGANVNVDNNAPIFWACRNALDGDDTTLIELLLEHGANQHTHHDLCLRMACNSAKENVIQVLLKWGGNLDCFDQFHPFMLKPWCEDKRQDVLDLLEAERELRKNRKVKSAAKRY